MPCKGSTPPVKVEYGYLDARPTKPSVWPNLNHGGHGPYALVFYLFIYSFIGLGLGGLLVGLVVLVLTQILPATSFGLACF